MSVSNFGFYEGMRLTHFKLYPLVIKDTMQRFFSMKSCRSRGSLSQLKAEYNRRGVSMDVSTSFNHVWDFIEVLPLMFFMFSK